MTDFKTDYLVVGAGATGLAFADTLLDETDAHITMVDRRDKAGGHWNDAYPFVRLHQPSSFYGVASTELGQRRIDQTGLNKGYEELASGPEVTSYLHKVMRDRLLASGRVQFLPMSEHLGGGQVRHLLSGKTVQVDARTSIVDATLIDSQIPLTHKRSFDVDPNVDCIPPNFLPRLAHTHSHFTILGAGKTAMDSLVWLLENGAGADQLRWVIPRDPWVYNRAIFQPGGAFYHETFGGYAKQLEAIKDARSVDDLADRMEAAGVWMRVDANVRPKIMHGPMLSQAELEVLRKIDDIVRMGYVKSITAEKLVLTEGECPADKTSLYVDCTAAGLNRLKPRPVFEEGKISLQMVRIYQPTFSAALLAKIESGSTDNKSKNKLAQPLPMTDTVESWVDCQMGSMMNQFAWSQTPELKSWIAQCRLDGFARAAAEVDRDDPEVKAIYQRLHEFSMPAFANLQKLSAG